MFRSSLVAVSLVATIATTGFVFAPVVVQAREVTVDDAETLTRSVDELKAEVARLQAEIERMQEERGSVDVSELSRRIEILSREIERLRGGGESPVLATESAHGLGPAASKIYRASHGVSLGGYGEMLYEAFDDERDDGTVSGRKATVDFLRAVLYAGYKFSDSILFNSEIEFEHSSTGKSGEVSVEFGYLEFRVKPEFNVRAGLLLVPVGHINELHEPPTYRGARRPEVERRILPTTWRANGFGLFGDHGKVSYRAYLMEGLNADGFTAGGLRDGRQSGSKALAEKLMLAARVDYAASPGVSIGASLVSGGAAQTDDTIDATTSIWDLHLSAERNGFQARALYTRASVGDVSVLNRRSELEGSRSIGSVLRGGYLELGYDVLAGSRGDGRALIPYVRFERLDTQVEVPEGFWRNPANRQDLWTFGIAYKPHPQIVVKADWTNVNNDSDTGVDQLSIQLGYIF